MIELFQNHLLTKFSFLKSERLLLAISGGIDSVVLAHLCHQLKLDVALAHCNFNLRGAESDEDENFVLQLADDLDLEVFIESFDTKTYAKSNSLSIQMAARELRYHWFEELSEQLKFKYILTAHHADDDLETFLINLSRGTGLEGLTGIPEVNGVIVRPLLPFSRQDIEDYAKQYKLKWRDDSSNALTKYVRNKLRHDVIPVLKEINPQLLQNFKNTLRHLQESKLIINDSIQSLISNGIVKLTDTGMQIDVSLISDFENPKAYLYYLLNDYGFSEWNDVVNLLHAQSGKQVFSEKWRLIKDRNHLILTERCSEEPQEIISINSEDINIETPIGILSFKEVDSFSVHETNCIYADKSTLKFPLLMRRKEEGDYFFPYGMKGKKKLSKYFKDEKMSLVDKENTWLLCSEDAIVWVIGKRADDRFKVTENTQQIIKIEVNEATRANSRHTK